MKKITPSCDDARSKPDIKTPRYVSADQIDRNLTNNLYQRHNEYI